MAEPFPHRVVLLGASNVTKGVSTIIETAELLLGRPLDVYCAIGHGRSYGMDSFVLVRGLPSILGSGLWNVLASQPRVPMYALVADVGNDVMYGPPPEAIAGWVLECLDRLHNLGAKTVVTGLPMERIEKLSDWHYLIARTIFFPTKRMTFADARQRAAEVIAYLERITSERGIPFVPLPASWYGVDPIHIQYRHRADAWSAILRHWKEVPLDETPRAPGSLRRWLRLRTLSPERWWLAGGIERGRAQPCATLPSGTRISMY